jgi:hypothetical protein
LDVPQVAEVEKARQPAADLRVLDSSTELAPAVGQMAGEAPLPPASIAT